MQRVHEKKLPYPLPPVSLINGEAPEKRGRHKRIGRLSAGDRCGQAAGVHAERRERVIAEDVLGSFAATATKGAAISRRAPAIARLCCLSSAEGPRCFVCWF